MTPKLPAKLEIIELPITAIKPYPTNPREHPEAQIQMLMASISRYGMNAPILINAQHDLIAGHGRLEAMKRLNLEIVSAIVLEHLTPEQERAYRIADNAISLKGEWSFDLLATELEQVEFNVDFDPFEIGFGSAEFEGILNRHGQKVTPAAEPVLPLGDTAVTQAGDLWIFGEGRHRLLCGDARDPAAYDRVLAGERADAVFADVPYNVPVNGHVGGAGRIKHREFQMATGEMTSEQFGAFLGEVFDRQIAASKPGAVHFQCIDWRSVALMIDVGNKRYDKLLNLCVWVKNVPGQGMPWRSQHELVCVFRTPGDRHRDNIRQGKFGRNRSNVWPYDGVIGFGASRADLKDHPTCKPVALVADAIRDVTDRNELVLDPFLGSGTTIVAAHQTGRRAAGIEIDPLYVDVAIRRIAERSGLIARLEDGRTFDEVCKDREGGR